MDGKNEWRKRAVLPPVAIEGLTAPRGATPLSRREFLRLAGLITGATALGGLAGCARQPSAGPTPQPAGQEPRSGGILKVAYTTEPIAMDPHLAVDIGTHFVAELVYSTLVALDHEIGIVPDLAESWEFSEDGQSVTFQLRRDAVFHNGDPVKASDVAFSLERMVNPDTGYPYRSSIEEIRSVDVLDDTSVRVNLTHPVGGLLTFLAFPGVAIVPQSIVEKEGDLRKQPVGSGPFIFESHQAKQMTRLKRNPNYFRGGLPYVDGIEMHYITDDTARTNALQTQVVDMIALAAVKDFKSLETAQGIVASNWLAGNWAWLGLNTQKKPFDDRRVRQAISYAIDRQAIIDSVFFGFADPIRGTVIPDWSWAHTQIEKYPVRPDVETARKLLAEAGYPQGFESPIILKLPADYPQNTKPGPIIQENLRQVGIDVELVVIEFGRWIEEVVVNADYDMHIIDWLSPLVDPDDHLFRSYHSTSPLNMQRYANAEVDSLLERAKHTFDQEQRRELYVQLQDILAEEVPLVPLYNERRLAASRDYVKGWQPMRSGMMRFLHETWLDS